MVGLNVVLANGWFSTTGTSPPRRFLQTPLLILKGTILAPARPIERYQIHLPLPINMEGGVTKRGTGRTRRDHTNLDEQAGLNRLSALRPLG